MPDHRGLLRLRVRELQDPNDRDLQGLQVLLSSFIQTIEIFKDYDYHH